MKSKKGSQTKKKIKRKSNKNQTIEKDNDHPKAKVSNISIKIKEEIKQEAVEDEHDLKVEERIQVQEESKQEVESEVLPKPAESVARLSKSHLLSFRRRIWQYDVWRTARRGRPLQQEISDDVL